LPNIIGYLRYGIFECRLLEDKLIEDYNIEEIEYGRQTKIWTRIFLLDIVINNNTRIKRY
jgi:hypothetical protein